MGRPRDEFAWKQVEVVGDNSWKCKYCSEKYSGAASRIRSHLSGQGNGIAACPAATESIRKEASEKVRSNKRVRLQDSSPSSSNDPRLIIEKRALEEDVADAFVKLLYCNNLSSVAKDVVKNPLYTEFVERASEYGFLSRSFWGDSFFIEKSVFNLEQEVKRYIQDVKDSWERTGCTIIPFNLQSHRTNGQVSDDTLEKDMMVTGFYCPKGMFFVEGMDWKDHIKDVRDGYCEIMIHSNYIYIDEDEDEDEDEDKDEDAYEYKRAYIDEDDLCELIDTKIFEMEDNEFLRIRCVHNDIQDCCIYRCRKSEWARSLIDIAVQIHKRLCSCPQIQHWYYKILRRQCLSFKGLANNHDHHTRCLSIFLSILSIGFEELRSLSMESSLHKKAWGDIEAITNGTKFWTEGAKLAQMLKYVMQIGDLTNTFVPTAGYFAMALDHMDNTSQHWKLTKDASQFWEKLIKNIAGHSIGSEQLLASYLNPAYFLQQLQHDSKADHIKLFKEELSTTPYIETQEVYEDVEHYANVFRRVAKDNKLEFNHPIKVWEAHGHDLPNLQRVAIIALSRPLSCMCKQVKKHLYQLEDAEDYILRLNVRMMHHFKHLGDDIYKPLDSFRHWYKPNDG